MILSASGARPVSSAYFGLTPRRYQSGDIDYTGRIPKCGDGLMRTYLFEAVNVLLTRVSTCSTLREAWGMRLAKRTGATKAKVALSASWRSACIACGATAGMNRTGFPGGSK